MTATHCAHSARDLEHRTAAFLAQCRPHLTSHELELYGYLANEPAAPVDAHLTAAALHNAKARLREIAHDICEVSDDLDVLQMEIEA